jgi:uncharacterized protein YbjT (DUF2867 family)
MRILLFGATGTAGSGILRACLQAPDVAEVRVLARRQPAVSHDKLKLFLHDDYLVYGRVRDAFVGVDACLYALGISVRQVSGEPEYRRITHDFAMAAAAQLKAGSPDAVLHFVSGEGTSLESRFMWARVKAETERDLAGVIATVCYRPGFIDGGSAATGPRLYRALRPLFRLLRFARALYVTSEDIGRAMLFAAVEGTRGGVIGNKQIRALADRARASACIPTRAR